MKNTETLDNSNARFTDHITAADWVTLNYVKRTHLKTARHNFGTKVHYSQLTGMSDINSS